MNPDLQKYLAEARIAGKSSSIVKSELGGAGWSEADIAQVLSGLNPSPISPLMQGGMVTAPAVAASSATGINFLIVLAVVLILGGGGFFIYMFTSSGVTLESSQAIAEEERLPTQSESNATVPAESAKSILSCKELLTESDSKKLLGEEADNFTVEEKQGSDGSLKCTYFTKVGDANNIETMFTTQSSIGLGFSFEVDPLAKGDYRGYEIQRDAQVSAGQATEIKNVGAGGWFIQNGGAWLLGRNKDYLIFVASQVEIQGGSASADRTGSALIAEIVEKNLYAKVGSTGASAPSAPASGASTAKQTLVKNAIIPKDLECDWTGINKVTILDNKSGEKTVIELKDGTKFVKLESGSYDAFQNVRPQFCFQGYFEILELARDGAPGFNTEGKWFPLADGIGHRRLSVVEERGKAYLIDEGRIDAFGNISVSLLKIALDTGFVSHEVKDAISGSDFMLSKTTEELVNQHGLFSRTISYN